MTSQSHSNCNNIIIVMISMIYLLKKGREALQMTEEIQISDEYIDRIGKILAIGNTRFRSREEFIISAIEKKLAEIKSTNK